MQFQQHQQKLVLLQIQFQQHQKKLVILQIQLQQQQQKLGSYTTNTITTAKTTCLYNVVGDEGVLELVGLPVSHELRSPDLDDVEVGRTEEQGWQGAGHQRPVVHPNVPAIPDGF